VGSFLPIAGRFHELPEMKRSETTPNAWTFYDLFYSDRIALLLTWYASSQDKRFAELAEFVATERKTHFDAWRDGRELVKLLVDMHSDEYGELENGPTLVELIEGPAFLDHVAARPGEHLQGHFAPGEAYQFDWSHETITLQGLLLTIKAAHMKVSNSRVRSWAPRCPRRQCVTKSD
jgi:hypothetical protein